PAVRRYLAPTVLENLSNIQTLTTSLQTLFVKHVDIVVTLLAGSSRELQRRRSTPFHPRYCNATFLQKITQTMTPKQCNALRSNM
ncbi:unnamed protein product, partial [Arctogadus glacialis]